MMAIALLILLREKYTNKSLNYDDTMLICRHNFYSQGTFSRGNSYGMALLMLIC